MGREARAWSVLTYWIPGIGMVALLVASSVFGTSQVEINLKDAIATIGGPLPGAMIMVIVVLYYFFMLNTFDPFWPLRKRLWKSGRMYLALDDSQNRAEPFIWSTLPLPASRDVSNET